MDSFFKQAVGLHKAGQVSRAIGMYRQLLESEPKQVVVNARIAIAYTQVKQFSVALPHYVVAIQGLPDDADLIVKGADCAIQCGDHERAEKWLRQYLSISPDNLPVSEALAGVLVARHQESEALNLIEQGLRHNPQNVSLVNLKGLVLCRQGDIDEGNACFLTVLRTQPGHLGALRNTLAYCHQSDESSERDHLLLSIIPKVETQYGQLTLQDGLKVNLAYLLFMYYENKHAEKAFRYLKDANDISAALNPYRHDQTQLLFTKLASIFSQSLQRTSAGSEVNNDSPIFILGMPRSGTTLIEQILSSHSQVEAKGEIDFLRRSFEQNGAAILDDNASKEQLVSASKATIETYLAKVKDVTGQSNTLRFTDKMPYNFMLVGLIAIFLPKAKIIHCTRDALETCFSIYKHNLSGNHGYTNNLESLGQYFNLYQSLMVRWKQQFGDRIYDVSYEKVVRSPAQEISKLLSFCELEQEPACLRPDRNKGVVRTASAAQVRQPIYQNALKASEPFINFLGPLIEVLNFKQGGRLS
jgi:tetratricopeptide (TPR) repeat protein